MSTIDTSKQFTITRTFNAPRELIWRAWTDPTLAARWWHPREVTTPPESVKIDLREGGRYEYLMVAPDGGQYPTAGSYLEVREPEHLKFTWGNPNDDESQFPVITVNLREDGDRTEMRFHLLGLDDDRGRNQYGVYEGWDSAFEILAGEVARRA